MCIVLEKRYCRQAATKYIKLCRRTNPKFLLQPNRHPKQFRQQQHQPCQREPVQNVPDFHCHLSPLSSWIFQVKPKIARVHLGVIVRSFDKVLVVGWGQPPSLGHQSPRSGELGVPVAAAAPFAALFLIVALSSPASHEFIQSLCHLSTIKIQFG